MKAFFYVIINSSLLFSCNSNSSHDKLATDSNDAATVDSVSFNVTNNSNGSIEFAFFINDYPCFSSLAAKTSTGGKIGAKSKNNPLKIALEVNKNDELTAKWKNAKFYLTDSIDFYDEISSDLIKDKKFQFEILNKGNTLVLKSYKGEKIIRKLPDSIVKSDTK